VLNLIHIFFTCIAPGFLFLYKAAAQTPFYHLQTRRPANRPKKPQPITLINSLFRHRYRRRIFPNPFIFNLLYPQFFYLHTVIHCRKFVSGNPIFTENRDNE
jgi:hypothetical protein